MNLTYKYSESNVKPSVIEIQKTTVYLRKNISLETSTLNDGTTYTRWVYQEAKLTVEEFNQNASALIFLNQASGDDDRLTIMEAIADLYDVIAMMQGG